MPRLRGRPRLVQPKFAATAKAKRIARMMHRVANVSTVAAGTCLQIARSNTQSWEEAFTAQPANTLLTVTRAVGTHAVGAKLLPDVAKNEAHRQMLEEVGKGACSLTQEVGRGAKSSITGMLSRYVTNLKLYAEAISSSKEYVVQARKSFTIAKCLQLNYDIRDFAVGTEAGSSLKHVDDKLIKIVECHFKRNSLPRIASRGKTSDFRDMPTKLCVFEVEWYAKFPQLCREVAEAFPDWYKSLASKTHLTQFEASAVASVVSKPADEAGLKSENNVRSVDAQINYYEKLQVERARALGVRAICYSHEKIGDLELKRNQRQQRELEKLRIMDMDDAKEDEGNMQPETVQASASLGIHVPGLKSKCCGANTTHATCMILSTSDAHPRV